MQILTRDEFFSSPDSVVSVLPRSPQSPFPEHVHEFDELVIVRSGSGVNYVDGKPSIVCRGSVFCVRVGQSHYIDRLDDLHLTNVLVNPASFKHVCQETMAKLMEVGTGGESASYMIGGITLKRVEALLNRIAEENEHKADYSAQMVELLLGQLMIELWRGQPEEVATNREDRDARLDKLLRYLNDHYRDDIDWEVLAKKFNLSLRTLGRRVTDITGVSPNGYLLRIRICAAQRMLRETSKSVTEIAFSCGFNDSNYFTNRFHRETGMAPLAYRKDVERSKPA